jgi:hypothetical protein
VYTDGKTKENSVTYFTYDGAISQRKVTRDNAGAGVFYKSERYWLSPEAHPRRKECVRASLGVMRLAGSRARHLSNKSTNEVRSLLSSSFI